MNNNYISAVYNKKTNRVLVWERDRATDQRRIKEYVGEHYYYVEDPHGDHVTLWGHTCRRVDCKNHWDMRERLEADQRCGRLTFEADFKPLDRCLMTHYYNVQVPSLHKGLVDIEVDYDITRGYSRIDNPYAPVNALTIYRSWEQTYYVLAVPPPGWDEATSPLNMDELGFNDPQKTLFSAKEAHLILCKNEAELLENFLDLLDDVDVVSGWNSEFFDVIYLAKRIEITLGNRAAQRLNFEGSPFSYEYREVEKFEQKETICALSGRVHLDYLQLFRKFSFKARTSYALAKVAEDETTLEKLNYSGSLEELYKTNFNWFIRYNIRDVEIIVALDEKFKFIDLANSMSHSNTVLMEDVFGSVKIIETGVTNYAHYNMNRIVGNKNPQPGEKAEGAIVINPKVGLHEWIGSVDINSLYPSTIRSLNMSPEMIVGQFLDKEYAWSEIYRGTDTELTFIPEVYNDPNGDPGVTYTAKEWKNLLVENKWSVSGFGTVFDQGSGMGLIPAILADWYAKRKEYQKVMKDAKKEVAELEKFATPEKSSSSDVAYKKGWLPATVHAKLVETKKTSELFDLQQHTMKIFLNSTYGALLNQWFLYSDPRLGASTTGSGRQITTHMTEEISYISTGIRYPLTKTTHTEKGETHHVYTTDSPVTIYGDTDSVAGDSILKTSRGQISIEDLFLSAPWVRNDGEKRHGFFDVPVECLTYDPHNKTAVYKRIREIYAHKTTKRRYRLVDAVGGELFVTGDHSCMVVRNGELVEVKPDQITQSDEYVCQLDDTIHHAPATCVEVAPFEDEWVYDVVMEDPNIPYFFANDILVHNSNYYKIAGVDNLEDAVKRADEIADLVNESFPGFMRNAFNCQPGYDDLIKCGREIVADTGMFIAKKKYIVRAIDVEGIRYDPSDDKCLKMQGVEIKKTDTPPIIQAFLKKTVTAMLAKEDYSKVRDDVLEFRRKLSQDKNAIFQLGVVKSANNLADRYAEWEAIEKPGRGKVNLPQNIRASINHNEFLKKVGDVRTKPIMTGQKVRIFYLEPNAAGFDSIAFSSDLDEFPAWFGENFAVDVKRTLSKLVDDKLSIYFAAVNWEVPSEQNKFLDDLFVF